MKLLHKTPCNECPWRRNHPAGWLGGYKPEEFTNQVHFDGPPVPCHKTIKDGEEAMAMCAGALIHMRNSCKSSRHPDYGDACEQIEADPVNVFSWPHEFLEHHRDPDGWVKNTLKKAEAGDPFADMVRAKYPRLAASYPHIFAERSDGLIPALAMVAACLRARAAS